MYPASLKYAMQKLAVSKQSFKLIPNRTDGVNQSSIVSIELPANSIVNLDSLFMSANVTVNGAGGTNNYVKLPKYAPIFSKIVVEIGGVSLHSCSYLEQIGTILSSLNLSEEERKRMTPYGEAASRTAPTATGGTSRLVVDKFLGFLGTASPRLLDTGLTNTIRLHFHLAAGDVLVTTDATNATFQLNDIYFGVDSIAIDDSSYYTLYDNYLSQSGNVLRVTYKNLYSSLHSATTQNQSARFSINTNSLDKLIATFLPTHGALGTLNATTGTSTYFNRIGEGVTSWNFSVNNVSMPQFSATADDAYPLAVNAFKQWDGKKCVEAGCSSAANWKNHYWVAALDFTLPTGVEDGITYVSGINTLATSAQLTFQVSGTAAQVNTQSILLVAECSSIVEIGANRSIQVIN